jgi:hypothetical protein
VDHSFLQENAVCVGGITLIIHSCCCCKFEAVEQPAVNSKAQRLPFVSLSVHTDNICNYGSYYIFLLERLSGWVRIFTRHTIVGIFDLQLLGFPKHFFFWVFLWQFHRGLIHIGNLSILVWVELVCDVWQLEQQDFKQDWWFAQWKLARRGQSWGPVVATSIF